jgi:hypothetical protein
MRIQPRTPAAGSARFVAAAGPDQTCSPCEATEEKTLGGAPSRGACFQGYNHRLTFATAAYLNVEALRLRRLCISGTSGLRRAGLVRIGSGMCPNLRVLDMSRCYGVGRADFCDVMLGTEKSLTAAGAAASMAAAASAISSRSPERRLRLRKLRVLVTPYQSAHLKRPLGQINVCEQAV